MLLTVFDRNNQKRTDLSPNDNGTQVKEIQADNILTLSFTLYEHIALDVNDYVDYMGERYWLMEKYRPKQKSTVEWEYNVKLYGIESLIKRFLVLKTVDGEDEPVFTLTAPPREHVAMIVQCINDGMGDITDFKVGTVEGTENITIDYEGKYCDAALKEIAEKVGAEWWAEGQTFNVCRCEHGEEITLGYGKGLTEIDNDTADNAKFYTRLFPIGSSKNIDREKYGYSRLQLPSKARYVDVNTDKYGIIHHYEASAFADIFPRRVGIVSSVRCEEVTGEDGNPFKIYYFRDDSLNFDPNEYELPQLVKRVSFQEGSELAGQGNEEDGNYFFEVNYNSDTREFEIITIWPYDNDLQLPNDTLIPKDRDRYILWNIRMPSEYYTLAEEEFLTAVEKYNEQHAIDVSRYKAPTDHVYIEDNNIDLFVGRRVRLESNKYFPEAGYRKSRITKITRKVNMPSQMDIEISDALSTGSLTKLGDDITDVKNYTKGIADSISLPDIIRSWDNTLPTDNNLFSARRSQQEFLSKTKTDRAKKRITFEEGADFGDYEQGEHGGTVDGKGNAELLSLVVRELLRSAKYVDGLTGEGFQLWIDGRGLANLTLDRLTVRQIMTVFEMLIQKVRSVGGQIVVSAANGKIKSVELVDGYYKITFEQENTFVAHDLMRAATFTGGTLKSYWVEIADIEGNSVLVAEEEFDTPPEVADECVLMGNTENPLRQSLISIAATEDGQPRIDVINGVNSKSFAGCLRARLGNLDGVKDDSFPLDRQPQGYGLYADNVYLRGTFLLDTGEDIKTQFKITEGKISAAVEGLRQDFLEDKGYLSNPTFGDGMEKWNTNNDVTFFLVGNKWIWSNNTILSDKKKYAVVTTDSGRTVVHIRDRYIKQLNGNLHGFPSFETNSEDKKEAVPVYLSFYYRCSSAGTLKIKFENVDKTGFANFDSFSVEEELTVTDGYKQYTCSGLWNGTGDFVLSFTGDIYLYMLVMSTDRVESLTYKYRTLFEQTEKLVKIAADCVDKDGNVIKLSELKVTVDGIAAEVSNAKGEISAIKQTASGITTEVSNVKGEISAIKQTVNGITTAVAAVDGRMSQLEINVNSISATVQNLNNSVSGFVTTADLTQMFTNGDIVSSNTVKNIVSVNLTEYVRISSFSTMFASAVNSNGIVKQADISAFVKKTDDGYLESNIKLRADHIKLEGVTTVNGIVSFGVDGTIKMGPFEILGDRFRVNSSGSEIVYFSDEHLGFKDSNRTFICGLETSSNAGVNYYRTAYAKINKSWTAASAQNIGFEIDVSGAPSSNTSAEYGNHALKITNGDIAGLRMRTRLIEANTTLTEYDNIIICAQKLDTGITITLPSTPKDAQFYMVKLITGDSNKTYVTINGNGKKIRHALSDDLADYDSVTLYDRRRWRIFVWCKSAGNSGYWVLGD